MWMSENIIDWVTPFVKKYYISLLFKFDSNYKAIQTRVNNVFDNYENDFKKIIIKSLSNDTPEELKNFINLLFNWNLWQNIEILKNDINNNDFISDLIYKYFTSNNEFNEILNELTTNLKSFREIFDKQISIYLKWEKINEKLLKKEKEYAVNMFWIWIKKFEKFYLKQINKFKKDTIPRLLFESNLPITKLEIEEIEIKSLKIWQDIENGVNDILYKELLKIIDSIIDDMIEIIKL